MNERGICLRRYSFEGQPNGCTWLSSASLLKAEVYPCEMSRNPEQLEWVWEHGKGEMSEHLTVSPETVTSDNIRTQKQKRIWTAGPLCSYKARWHQIEAREWAYEQGTSAWAHILATYGHNPHILFCQCLHHKAACWHWFSAHLNTSESNSGYLKTW